MNPWKMKLDLSKVNKLIEDKDAEIARLKGIDETVSSTREKEKEKEEKKSAFELKQLEIAKKAGISPETLKKNIERRAKISGAV